MEVNAKTLALEDELKSKTSALLSMENKMKMVEEAYSSDVEQLNNDVLHFRTLYENLTKSLKNTQKYYITKSLVSRLKNYRTYSKRKKKLKKTY